MIKTEVTLGIFQMWVFRVYLNQYFNLNLLSIWTLILGNLIILLF